MRKWYKTETNYTRQVYLIHHCHHTKFIASSVAEFFAHARTCGAIIELIENRMALGLIS